ncbi:MAG: hypothetical protein U5Q03_01805 [Bacteroidota bacterium]|nr:hypothetical protein [Bacteroidota bacterium]
MIGIFVDIPTTDTNDLAGAIGKVERYRNVQITGDDILLRNELVEDSAKRELYGKYLSYYYYKALRTANDLDKILDKTKQVEEFSREYRAILMPWPITGSILKRHKRILCLPIQWFPPWMKMKRFPSSAI